MFGKDGPSFAELMREAFSSTEEGYDLLAPKFDKTPFRTPDELVEATLACVTETVDDALDLCCGTGAGLIELRKKTARRLVGVDFSKNMLEEARHELGLSNALKENAAPTIELVQRDVMQVDYNSEFDLVTCFGAFGHILEADEPRFLDLVRRALRPGGEFVFATVVKPPFYSPRALIARGFNAAMHARNLVKSPPFVMYYLTFMMPEIGRKLRWAGFEPETHTTDLGKPFDSLVVVRAKRR